MPKDPSRYLRRPLGASSLRERGTHSSVPSGGPLLKGWGLPKRLPLRAGDVTLLPLLYQVCSPLLGHVAEAMEGSGITPY